MTGFLGPNGAGKTTTTRMLVGLSTPDSGQARLFGERYRDLPNPGRRVGILLDASAQHAGRRGREALVGSARTMGLPIRRVDTLDSSASTRQRRHGGSAGTHSGCANASASPTRCSGTPRS